MSLLRTVASTGAVVPKLDASDVFSAYLTTGTGASLTVTTGIDLATKGGAIFRKGRSGATDWAVYDTARGVTKDLVTNSTAAETTQVTGLKAVSTTGHTIGTLAKMNTSGSTYVDYVWRKAPKFFDIVTYTGNGVAGRQIPHNLGCEVGMIIVKCLNDGTRDWAVNHNGINGSTHWLQLNTTSAELSRGDIFTQYISTSDTTTTFKVGDTAWSNGSGNEYVAYLYAHDTSADGIIQCGSYVGNAGVKEITLGWEAQYVMVKRANGISNWTIIDSMRGWVNGGIDVRLMPSNSNVEGNINCGYPTSTGFSVEGNDVDTNANGSTYIYMAIRRPMKVPTSGTEVFAIDRGSSATSIPTFDSGFIVDAAIFTRTDNNLDKNFSCRLTGSASLQSTQTWTESGQAENVFDSNKGWGKTYTSSYISWMFKRAKGFFDVVCYTGTGVARTVNHNLGVVPELMIVKTRSVASSWDVYNVYNGNMAYMYLNAPDASVSGNTDRWNATSPSSTVFTVGTNYHVNNSGTTYVSYLFSSLAGVSKVGSYTGNGTNQTIACGFTTGARFVLIKRTDSTGDWYIWDTVRGIVAGNDPHLSLNTTAAEVTTDDSIDPSSEGFICNQNATTNINVNLATYIFLSIS